jgi:hypothetical protein
MIPINLVYDPATGSLVYDPATGASRRIIPDHAPIAGITDPLYQIQAFSRAGEAYLAFLATDEEGKPGTPILYGIAPLSHLTVPESLATWRTFRFGTTSLTPALESTLWGNDADPDKDGLANLLEYALSTPPLTANPSATSAGLSNGRLSLTFSRNPLRQDLRYTVESSASPDTGSWTPLAMGQAGAALAAVSPALPEITETASGNLFTVQVRAPMTTSSKARHYLRLRVTVLP